MPSDASLTELRPRVHLFVHPQDRAAFTRLFREVLNCNVQELQFGLPHPILLVTFPKSGAFSVEFSDNAPTRPTVPVDDDSAFRGAWIEFVTDDVSAVHAALRHAGVPEFRHPGSPHTYFAAPGGQVFRVIDPEYQGP